MFILPSEARQELQTRSPLGETQKLGAPCAHPSSRWPQQPPASSAVAPSMLQPPHSLSTSCVVLALVAGTRGIGSLLL